MNANAPLVCLITPGHLSSTPRLVKNTKPYTTDLPLALAAFCCCAGMTVLHSIEAFDLLYDGRVILSAFFSSGLVACAEFSGHWPSLVAGACVLLIAAGGCLYQSLLSLARLQHPLYDPGADLFSLAFVERERRVGTMDRVNSIALDDGRPVPLP